MKYLKTFENLILEYEHSDIKVLKGWGGESGGLEINGEYVNSKVIEHENLPDKLYHVSIFKNKILSDGFLKAQKWGAGFGGGRIEGISVTSDIELAYTYYWGIYLAVLLSKAKTREDLEKLIDEWLKIQEKRVGKNIDKMKLVFFDDFDSRQKLSHNEPFIESVENARRMMCYTGANIDVRLNDPVIIGGIERLKTVDINNVIIFVINKNDINKNTPVITGTDTHEIRILGDVPIKDYIEP
jgi:hypothetical protein